MLSTHWIGLSLCHTLGQREGEREKGREGGKERERERETERLRQGDRETERQGDRETQRETSPADVQPSPAKLNRVRRSKAGQTYILTYSHAYIYTH